MVVYTVECVECGGTRVGRERDEGVVPVRDACAECGETEFIVPTEANRD